MAGSARRLAFKTHHDQVNKGVAEPPLRRDCLNLLALHVYFYETPHPVPFFPCSHVAFFSFNCYSHRLIVIVHYSTMSSSIHPILYLSRLTHFFALVSFFFGIQNSSLIVGSAVGIGRRCVHLKKVISLVVLGVSACVDLTNVRGSTL